MRPARLTATVAVVLVAALGSAVPASARPQLTARTVQRGLDIPWDVAFAPDGRMVVSERPGRLRVYASGRIGAQRLDTLRVPRVRAEGEAGVMGLAVRRGRRGVFVYVCASRTNRHGHWRNQVLRYRLTKAGRLRHDRFVLGGMRAARVHNGCAVEVGPDRKIWVTMGDASNLSLPQNRRSRNGKVLRVNWDGSAPKGNPYAGSPVYTRGHRNPQGIAFHPRTGRAYVVEHGPERNDEINRIVKGGNYGWPYCAGTAPANGYSRDCSRYRRPAWQSGFPTIAPSGATFVRGDRWGTWRRSLFVATLKESDLRRFTLADEGRRARQRTVLYDGVFGRLRAAVQGPARLRALFLTTSDGGANDRVVRIRADR